MLSKEELKLKNLQFWHDFKLFMSKTKSSNGKRITWLSYPTDLKHIYLRIEVDKKSVSLNFDIQFKDLSIREIFWEQMEELKVVLENEIGIDGIWIKKCHSESIKEFSRIQWNLTNVNYLDEKYKDQIFNFLKTKLVAFDTFYQEFKDILINLVK